MTHVTCRLTAKNRDELRNHTLGNRVCAKFTFFRWIAGWAIVRLCLAFSLFCSVLFLYATNKAEYNGGKRKRGTTPIRLTGPRARMLARLERLCGGLTSPLPAETRKYLSGEVTKLILSPTPELARHGHRKERARYMSFNRTAAKSVSRSTALSADYAYR